MEAVSFCVCNSPDRPCMAGPCQTCLARRTAQSKQCHRSVCLCSRHAQSPWRWRHSGSGACGGHGGACGRTGVAGTICFALAFALALALRVIRKPSDRLVWRSPGESSRCKPSCMNQSEKHVPIGNIIESATLWLWRIRIPFEFWGQDGVA